MKILRVGYNDILLDDWDWLRLCKYKWRVKNNGLGHKSIARTYRKKGIHYTVYMHRDIMKTPEGMECHHKNENPFDNQTENLENLTPTEHREKHAKIDRKRNETDNKSGL